MTRRQSKPFFVIMEFFRCGLCGKEQGVDASSVLDNRRLCRSCSVEYKNDSENIPLNVNTT